MNSCSLVKILKPGIRGRIHSLEGELPESPYDRETAWFPGDTLMLDTGISIPLSYGEKWKILMLDYKVYLVPRWGFTRVEPTSAGEEDDDSEKFAK